ncbi:DivIVA domain-containing protein [Ancrocorticia populi]|uniref:Cell division protein DivIVA n=1 Tax=Ancrocorticia populi TaxID=2175228 RepID=A0A2V1K3V3_9ACTO|nr:DivIVA domain-containing protein [Ancrocorticia populi]PWF25751.1 cell division protein DivIVA [Ancrocorticia populi]
MSNDTFERVGRFGWGYDPIEVDEFLAEAKTAYAGRGNYDLNEQSVRNAGFSRVRHGYDPKLVDAAMDRLEAAFIQRRRANVVRERGESTWLNKTYEDAKSLYPRLLRPQGERFSDATGWGYLKSDVDELMDRLMEYFDGKRSLTSSELRDAVFDQAKDSKGYDVSVVDVYIERAITVLVAVE